MEKAICPGLAEAQKQLEIIAKEYEIEIDWQKVTENDVCGGDVEGDLEWEVTVTAEVTTQIGVSTGDWKEAAKVALYLAQNNLDVVSQNDVNIDWQQITEDMVD